MEDLIEKRAMLESRIEIEQQIRKMNPETAFAQKNQIKQHLEQSFVQKWLNSQEAQMNLKKLGEIRKDKQITTLSKRVYEIKQTLAKQELKCKKIKDLYGNDSEVIEKRDDNIEVYLNSLLDE